MSNRGAWVRKQQRWERTQILSLWLLGPDISHHALSLSFMAHYDRNISTELIWGINEIISKRNLAKGLSLIKCPWIESFVIITVVNIVQLWAALWPWVLPANQGSILELELFGWEDSLVSFFTLLSSFILKRRSKSSLPAEKACMGAWWGFRESHPAPKSPNYLVMLKIGAKVYSMIQYRHCLRQVRDLSSFMMGSAQFVRKGD